MPAGGQKFSKFDLSQDKRLPFGIALAPAIFQHQMEKILQGIPNIACYLDDVLITGKNDTEHVTTLEKVFERLYQWGLHLKKTK